MTHCGGGNFKKQFKRADKVGAKFALVIGETEVKTQQVVVKDLLGGAEQLSLALTDVVIYLKQAITQ